MITLTPLAAEQIIKAAQQSGAENMALRIAARQEPDGSMMYGMGFDDVKDDDLDFMSEGVTLLVSPGMEVLLQGTVIDFVEMGPGEYGFAFMNPNDKGGSCGSRSGGGGGCGGGCGSGGGCA